MTEEVFGSFGDLLKAHVQGYTRSDGTYVKDHEDKRQKKGADEAPEHPSAKSVAARLKMSYGETTYESEATGAKHQIKHLDDHYRSGMMRSRTLSGLLHLIDNKVNNKAPATGTMTVNLSKSHVQGYTRSDGTFVAEHDDKRQAAQPKPTPLGAHADALAASSKQGDLDHDDNQWASKLMKQGDAETLRGHLRGLDTGARDHILDHVHPDHWEGLGFKPLDKERSIAEHNKRFGGGEIEKVAHSKGYKPGASVMFPHPDKPGKKALGTYMGQRNGKSVIKHKDHGEIELDHGDVSGARGVPKAADPEAARAAGEAVRQLIAANTKKDVKTENEGYGFHGEAVSKHIRDKHGPDTYHGSLSESDMKAANDAGHKAFSDAANKLVSGGHFKTHEQARDYLDSTHGRHLHDGASFHGGDISKVEWLGKDVASYKKRTGMAKAILLTGDAEQLQALVARKP